MMQLTLSIRLKKIDELQVASHLKDYISKRYGNHLVGETVVHTKNLRQNEKGGKK